MHPLSFNLEFHVIVKAVFIHQNRKFFNNRMSLDEVFRVSSTRWKIFCNFIVRKRKSERNETDDKNGVSLVFVDFQELHA